MTPEQIMQLDGQINALPDTMGMGPFLFLCGLIPLVLICWAIMAVVLGSPRHTEGSASMGPVALVADADWDGYTGSFVGPEWLETEGAK